MRGRLDRERPGKSVWDLKEAKGGLFDVEFVAQGLQLVSAPQIEEMLRTNTLEALRSLHAAGVLADDDARILTEALGLYQQVIQILRLTVGEAFVPGESSPSLRQLVASIAGVETFEAVETELAAHEVNVRDAFTRLMGCPTGS